MAVQGVQHEKFNKFFHRGDPNNFIKQQERQNFTVKEIAQINSTYSYKKHIQKKQTKTKNIAHAKSIQLFVIDQQCLDINNLLCKKKL